MPTVSVFYRKTVHELQEVGCALQRVTDGHDIYLAPSGKDIVVPRHKLEDPRVVNQVRRKIKHTQKVVYG